MSSIRDEIKKAINESLSGVISESYVTEPKSFNLKTESISEKVKKARQEEFEGCVKSLHEISAQLDTVDRETAGDKKSMFRGLKVDEAHCMNAAFLRALHF